MSIAANKTKALHRKGPTLTMRAEARENGIADPRQWSFVFLRASAGSKKDSKLTEDYRSSRWRTPRSKDWALSILRSCLRARISARAMRWSGYRRGFRAEALETGSSCWDASFFDILASPEKNILLGENNFPLPFTLCPRQASKSRVAENGGKK